MFNQNFIYIKQPGSVKTNNFATYNTSKSDSISKIIENKTILNSYTFPLDNPLLNTVGESKTRYYITFMVNGKKTSSIKRI